MPLYYAYTSGGASPSKPKVVIVDDEQAIVDTVCDVLEDEGIPATSCPHGNTVDTCIRQKQPEVVILDVQMPGLDGIEVFRRLRADPATSAIPVIFFTANAHKLHQRLPDYAALGATLLPKPFDIDKLIDAVQQALAAS